MPEAAKKEKSLDPVIMDLLKSVADHFEQEDRVTRERQIRHWRRLKFYWNSFSQVYWSESAQDYRIAGRDTEDNNYQDYYDKPVNVFKAFLETIIAALSIQIPAINCVPDDADNPLDLSTARAGNKISELIYKHNNVMFLWLHALYIYCTEGMIACYSYSEKDKKYGTYQKDHYGEEEVENYVCPLCQTRQPDENFAQQEMNEFAPAEDDVLIDNILEAVGPVCIECGTMLDPSLQKIKLIIPKLVGTTAEVKSGICLEVYGGLYVKVANYAKKQADTPYLIFSHETHYTNALEAYPGLRGQIARGGEAADPYEQYGRLNTQYRGELPEENVTVKCCWLRVSSFNILTDEQYELLKTTFPDGVKVVIVNDVVGDYKNESLDDHWTLSENPMSDFLNHDPLGELLTNVQDIVNDLVSLTLQTIEHGIAQTWADPAVVNFTAQKQIEAMPGTITPTKPVAGTKSIAEAFHTSTLASLSPEIFNFYRIVQELGQFVSGALPSLFGGQQGGNSSGTASEYAMAKGMALQRLQTPWKMMNIWWKTIFGKVIPLYMKNMVEDDRMVEKDTQGNFINVFIRKAEIDGKIGGIELESEDKLPVTDEQQAEMIMQLMQLNNEEITAALLDPQNIPFVKKIIKISAFRIPGEDDRQKQYEEINELVNSIPILQPPDPAQMAEAMAMGMPLQPVEMPSIEVDPDVDNHMVEGSICRSWLVSAAGRLAKIENPDGYKNVLLHMKQHMMIFQQQQMMQQQAQQTSDAAEGDKKRPRQAEKISGEKDARSPVK